jgi:hypothetical protein
MRHLLQNLSTLMTQKSTKLAPMLCFAVGLALAGLLAACGGSDSAGNLPQPSFASAAMFVPPGQDKITVPLTCNRNPGATSATLVMDSSGNLTFSGAPGTSTAVIDILQMKYADATYRLVDSEVGVRASSANATLRQGDKYIMSFWYNNGIDSDFVAKTSASAPEYKCRLPLGADSYSLKHAIDESRLAAKVLKGVNQISSENLHSSSTAALTGGVAYWDNHFDGLASADAAQNAIRYFSVNLTTGAIFASPAPSVPAVSATNIALALPTATTSYGYFFEAESDGEKRAYLQIEPSMGASIRVYLKVLANILKPQALVNSEY